MNSAERATLAECPDRPYEDGPYETEGDASARVRDIYAAFHKRGVMQAKTLDRLLDACERSGVQLGTYDRHILTWLSAQKPEMAQVVAGLIRRAGHGAADDGPTAR
jgi:membrane carboxypeptidase/penicillin-binding protein PbpC